jgi:hypothetical protein
MPADLPEVQRRQARIALGDTAEVLVERDAGAEKVPRDGAKKPPPRASFRDPVPDRARVAFLTSVSAFTEGPRMHAQPLRKLAQEVAGLPLSVALADGELLAAIRERLEAGDEVASIPLAPPFHVSDDDAYLVLPEDIGVELRDMFAEGDVDLLADAMREGLLVIGALEKAGRGKMSLAVEQVAIVERLLRTMPYADTVEVGRGADPVEALNALPQCRNTVASSFVDLAGLQRIVRAAEHAGPSWRPPTDRKEMAGVDPTFAWSKRLADGRIGVEAALFCEYEELVVVLRPAALRIQVGKPALVGQPSL